MLDDEQARFAMRQMTRWLRTRIDHENLKGKLSLWEYEPEVVKRAMVQMSADVDHSALLYRLLRGRDPLPKPPPLEHAYPVYPDEDDPAAGLTGHESYE